MDFKLSGKIEWSIRVKSKKKTFIRFLTFYFSPEKKTFYLKITRQKYFRVFREVFISFLQSHEDIILAVRRDLNILRFFVSYDEKDHPP